MKIKLDLALVLSDFLLCVLYPTLISNISIHCSNSELQ